MLQRKSVTRSIFFADDGNNCESRSRNRSFEYRSATSSVSFFHSAIFSSESVRSETSEPEGERSEILNSSERRNGTMPPFENPATGTHAERDSRADNPNVSRNVDGISEISETARVSDIESKGRLPKYATEPPGREEKRFAQSSDSTPRRSKKPFRQEKRERNVSESGPSQKTATLPRPVSKTVSKNGNSKSNPFSGTSLPKKTKLRMGAFSGGRRRFGVFRNGIKETGERKERERRVRGLVAMEEKVHGGARYERREKRRRSSKEREGDDCEDGKKREECRQSSFHELLNVPTFGNVVIFFYFRFPAIQALAFVHGNHEAVRRPGRSEAFSENRVVAEPFDTGNHPIEMPLRRIFPKNDAIHASFELDVEGESEEGNDRNREKRRFLMVLPNRFYRNGEKRSYSEDRSYERGARIGIEDESENDERPNGYGEHFFFFRAKEMEQEPQVREHEERGRIRSVEYPLEASDVRPVDAVIDRNGSSKFPIGKVWGKSEVEENFLAQNKAHESSYGYGEGCRIYESPNVFRYFSRKERQRVAEHDESEKEFEIVSASESEVPERSAVHDSGENHPCDVTGDKRVYGIELRPRAFFVVRIRDDSGNRKKQELFRVVHSGNAELVGNEDGGEDAERKEREEGFYEKIENFRHGTMGSKSLRIVLKTLESATRFRRIFPYGKRIYIEDFF